MIIFESRITKHVGIVSLEALRSWGITFDFPSEANQKIFEEKVSQLKEDPSSNINATGGNSLMLYLYKPEAYFHLTYHDILDLSEAGLEVTLESNSIVLINYFGEQIDRGLVSKDVFKVRLEVEKDGSLYFLDLEYDSEGLLDGKGDEYFPIGYLN